jgi:hypothetical protein
MHEAMRALADSTREWAGRRWRLLGRRAQGWGTNGILAIGVAIVLLAAVVVTAVYMGQGPSVVAITSPTSSPPHSPSQSTSRSPTPTPTIETAAVQTPPDRPSVPPHLMTASPTPLPSIPPGSVRAPFTAIADCDHADSHHAVGEGRLYIRCGVDPTGTGTSLSYILGVDAASGRVVFKQYDAKAGYLYHLAAVDHGLWISSYDMRPASLWESRDVERWDEATGERYFHMDNWVVAADGLGYIWATHYPELSGDGSVLKIDPATANWTELPFPYRDLFVGCGSLWGVGGTDGTSARLDPDTGAPIQTIANIAAQDGIVEIEGRCWTYDSGHLFEIGTDPIDDGWPPLSETPNDQGPHVLRLGSTLWWLQNWGRGGYSTMQRIDPARGERVGEVWAIDSSYTWNLFEAGGHLWSTQDDDSGGGLIRYDLPLDPL